MKSTAFYIIQVRNKDGTRYVRFKPHFAAVKTLGEAEILTKEQVVDWARSHPTRDPRYKAKRIYLENSELL